MAQSLRLETTHHSYLMLGLNRPYIAYNYHIMQQSKHNMWDWTHASFWAAVLLAIFVSISYWAFTQRYIGRVYPNVTVNGISFAGKTPKEVKEYWLGKNDLFP